MTPRDEDIKYNGYPWLLCSACEKLIQTPYIDNLSYDIKGELKCATCNTVLKFITILYLGDADVRHLQHMQSVGGGGFYAA